MPPTPKHPGLPSASSFMALLGVSALMTPPVIFGAGYYCGRTRPVKTYLDMKKVEPVARK